MQTRAPLHNKTSREKHTTPHYNIQKTIETLVSTLQHTQQRTDILYDQMPVVLDGERVIGSDPWF